MKFNSSLIVTSLCALTLSGCVVVISPSHANFQKTEKLSISAEQLKTLQVDVDSGFLIIKGDDDISEIQVSADIYTAKDNKDNYKLSLNKFGENAYLDSAISTSGFYQGNSPRIDITVSLPSHLLLNIKDGSGDIEVSKMNSAVSIDDGSGSIKVYDIANKLMIEDGSGAITVNNVIGDLEIEDNSGGITVNQVVGDIKLTDGSGSILVDNVEGNLILEDSSGSIEVTHVSGKVTIDDGSGDINVNTVGELTIIDDGSGDLNVKNVKGKFDIGS